jgi:hemolysin activation/secretion protein
MKHSKNTLFRNGTISGLHTFPVCAVLAALLLPGGALAQQVAMPAATGVSTTFTISGFELTGDVQLPSAETTLVLAPFIGPGATIETLQKATAALEAALKAKGFALHRVSLPPQEVGKAVTLNIVKFVIGKVTVLGNTAFTQANIRASVPELTEGQAPNFSTLAVQTAIANENPSKQVKVTLKESEEADKIDAVVQVQEAKPWSFSASLANTGSDATGQDRLSVVGGHSNFFGLDHQFSGAYTTSLERSSDVKQLGLNYRIPFYKQGGVMGLSYTTSDVVGSFGSFTSTGAGQTYGVNYSIYQPPVGGRRSYLNMGLDEKRFIASKVNGLTAPGQLDRTSRPLTLAYVARIESDAAVWAYNLDLAFNLSGGSGNDLTSYQSEDPRVDTANWKTLRGGASYLTSFYKGWLWGVRGQFQYSPDALISGEQFGIGGASSVRGTGERPVSGDSGMLASVEITTPSFAPGLNALAFVDGGWLNNHNSARNANKPESDQLVSVGLGLRYQTGKFGLVADWGRLITGSSVPLSVNSNAPQAGTDKIHLNMTARF